MTHKSREWFLGAAHATVPVGWRKVIVCDEDCDSCPLAINGCARSCTRWETLVCYDCPCLGNSCWRPEDKRTCVDPAEKGIVDMPCIDMLKRQVSES
jgi:hypothetical protein